MTKAKVTKSFKGVPDGEVHAREIGIDEVIEGSLAAVAIEQKWANQVDEDAIVTGSLESGAPAKTEDEEAGEGESSAASQQGQSSEKNDSNKSSKGKK